MFLLCGLWAFAAELSAADSNDDQQGSPAERPRAREVGITIGVLPTGTWNSITDVEGVLVGHKTIIEGDQFRTGATAIVPHNGNIFQQKVPAAIVVGNGFGKLVGISQVEELGLLETPIILTSTLSTFTAADALIAYTLRQSGNQNVFSVNPVVGECNDAFLNDIRAQRLKHEDVYQAIESAQSGAIAEGSVGAGTGTRCFGWKGGIGTSSRHLPDTLGGYTLGVLVQTNFGGILSIAGAPVGKELGRYYLQQHAENEQGQEQGSCVVVVATDAPVDARQLKRIGRRALLGLAATGSPMTHGSGDYVIAFSTNKQMRTAYQSKESTTTREILQDEALSPLFQAAREATEEAVVNSLFQATTVQGFKGHVAEAIPLDRVLEICRRHNVLQPGDRQSKD